MRSAGWGLLLLGWLSLATAQQPATPPAPAEQPAAPTVAQRYGAAMDAAVTTPVCAGCHERQSRSIVLTAHGAKNDASGSMCQACHGDATEHMKDPTKVKPANPFNKLHPALASEQSQVCLNCHVGQRHLAFWESSRHAQQDVPCSSCHSMHGTEKNPPVAPFTTSFRPNEADLCGTCHQQIRSAIMKPSHHPIIENKMKCSDCHNPHGALSPVMLKNESVNAQCTSCHADKRGPFVFNHPPVQENCLSCHNPHGSSHEKLLNDKAPNLCQDCHVTGRHPTNFYGSGQGWLLPNGQPNSSVNTRLIAQGCINCHNAIHGSNAPSSRGQFFIR